MGSVVFKRTMNLGTGAAENDGDFLKSCFLETPEFETLLDFEDKKTILLGRTGSGKTALIKMWPELKDIIHIEIRPDTFALQYISNIPFIRSMKNAGLNLDIFYKFLWLHEIISNVIKQYFWYNKERDFFQDIGEKLGFGGRVSQLKKYLETYEDVFFKDESISKITNGIENKLGKELGFESFIKIAEDLTESQKQEIQTKTSQQINSDHIKQLKNIITIFREYFSKNKEQKIVITIDKLDENWMDEQSKYGLVSALLDATRMFIDVPNLKIVIAMRSDLLNKTVSTMNRQAEKDTAFTLKINWKLPMLEKLLDKRINFLLEHKYARHVKLTFRELFDCDISGVKGYDYILQRTMMRPRDAIEFVNFCLIEADDESIITPVHIIRAEETYRGKRLEALMHEWEYVYPNIDIYLKSIRDTGNSFKYQAALSRYDDIEKTLLSLGKGREDDPIISAFLSCNDEYCRSDNIKKLLNTLFIVGILGKETIYGDILYSTPDSPELGFLDYDDYVFRLHPLFKKMETSKES